MARRPARLERAGALTPRDRMWAVMRAMNRYHAAESRPDFFTPAEVMAITGLQVETVCTYFRGLANAGYLQLVAEERPAGKPRRECSRYSLVRDVGVDTPNVNADGKPTTPGQGNEQMWIAMKAAREFDCIELACAASTPERQVSIQTVKNYVTFLVRAGYLVVSAKSKPGTQARYRFNRARNTGPRAPLICRDKSVMDANTGAIVWTPPK